MHRIFAAAIMLAPVGALAAPVELDLPGQVERTTVVYSCSDGVDRSADYINVGENSLAIVGIDGAPVVFVNVIAGSGARYAARQYVWWSKGESVTFSNEMESDAAPVTCTQKKA
ncbi:MliC family protein [Aureimonas altamirensis]|uniref:MliC family protein n=1 Tax=Aureimonas altamirensis TaxID=370622 RepID=UPI00203674FB|nr:MliC family protein [Aureimonas altamirensis]MCM2502203.1 MliC family protein [Aureimonas altamirensis]